jgi:hypothetical protein
MDFRTDVTDYGAPEFLVSGPVSISWINAHQLRFTYYSKRTTGDVVSHHAVWDIDDLRAAVQLYNTVFPEIFRDRVLTLVVRNER